MFNLSHHTVIFIAVTKKHKSGNMQRASNERRWDKEGKKDLAHFQFVTLKTYEGSQIIEN